MAPDSGITNHSAMQKRGTPSVFKVGENEPGNIGDLIFMRDGAPPRFAPTVQYVRG